MDQNQKAIITEIRSLERKLQSGNKGKIQIGSLMGIGVAAIGTAVSLWYCPETLIEAIPYAPLTQLLVGNAGLALMMGSGGYFLTNGEKEAKVALDNAFVKRIDDQFKSLKDPKAGSKIDFIFNIESSVYPEHQKKTKEQVQDAIEIRKGLKTNPFPQKKEEAILPLNMADYYTKIGLIFSNLFKMVVEKRPLVERIDLKNAEMTDEQFQHLLAFGLGCCGTKTLDLSKNRLTVLSIQTLHSQIVSKKTAFGKLKSLNLSYNNLNKLSLDKIIKIVRYLGIEELDLSGNNLNGSGNNVNEIDPDLRSFLENQATFMPSLKVLKISDIGLTDNFSKSIKSMIKQPSILTHLDITRHPHLTLRKLQSILNRAYGINQSIREFVIDQPENLNMDSLVQSKNSIYASMYMVSKQEGDKEVPRFIYLLNQFWRRKDEKLDVKDCFSPELYEQLEFISTEIMSVRKKALDIEVDYSIPVTEKEFILFKNKTLYDFYCTASQHRDTNGLDQRLFNKDIEKTPKALVASNTVYLIHSREQLEAQKIKLDDKVKLGLFRAF